MILYRFAHKKYAHDLSGEGARLFGGRWNPPGIPVLYTSESISLALVEMLVNTHTLEQLKLIQLMEIHIPANAEQHELRLQSLKANWFRDFDYTQWMGEELLLSKKCLICKCPSAVVQREHNYLINTLHPDFKKIRLQNAADFHFDERLFKHQGSKAEETATAVT